MNFFAVRLLGSLLCFPLALGSAFAPPAHAVTGVITRGATVSTAGRIGKQELEREKRTAEEKQIDTALEAEQYVSSTLAQNRMFADQCANTQGEIDNKKAFMLSDDIPYADLNVRNCGQEREKLYHMNRIADDLVSEFDLDLEQTDCDNCSVPSKYTQAESETVPPGQACSLEAQARFKKEPCNTYCMWKPALSVATAGMGPLLAGAFTGGKDGCPKQNLALATASCAVNMIKGLILGIWEAITGLAKLVWEGLKWCANKVKQGAKWLFWDAWVKTENKTSSSAHAVSQSQKKEVEAFEKDKKGWLRKTFDTVLNFLKDLVYIGFFEQESKCMNCAQKGQLMCEIGGRVASDVVGFTFTMGAGYAAMKTAVAKLGPKVADLLAKTAKVLPKAGTRGTRVLKAAGETIKKPVKWAGKAAIKSTRTISKAVVNGWRKMKTSKIYRAIMTPDYSRALDGIKLAGKKVGESIPGKVVISTGRGVKTAVKKYFEFDDRVFQKGFLGSANAFRTAGIGMSKTEISRIYLTLAEKGRPAAGAARVDRNGNQVLRLSPQDLSNEQIAQMTRAGIRLDEVAENGEVILRIPTKTFDELKAGTYATRTNALGIPVGTDGSVLIKQGDRVIERKAESITPAEFAALRGNNAVFTTKEHPRAWTPLDPNRLSEKGIKVGTEGEIVLKNTDTGAIEVLDASTVTADDVANWKKKGYPMTHLGDPEWNRPVSKAGVLEGDQLNHTASARMHQLRNSGKGEEATRIALDEVESLQVLKETGEISGASVAARDRLIAQGKVKAKHLEGIQESIALETTYLPEKNKIRFENPQGGTHEISVRKGAPVTLELFQEGKMAIVRDLERGTTELHDLTRKKTKIADFTEKDLPVLNEAMAKTVRGKPAPQAALDEVKTRLDLQKNTNYRVIETQGEQKIEIPTGPECRPSSIQIGSDAAK